jgi:hypothetical protein
MNSTTRLSAIAIGVLLWYVAACVVRYAGPAVFAGDDTTMLAMLLSAFPFTLLALWLIGRLLRRPLHDLLEATLLITTTAALLDGLAMPYFRTVLYHEAYAIAERGGAWILWGVSVALLAGYFLQPAAQRLARRQFLVAVGLGVAFWLNGVVVIHLLGDELLTDGNPYRVLGLLLVVPVTVLTQAVIGWVMRLPAHQLVQPLVVGTLVAACCDAVALTWFQPLYSAQDDVAYHGAALILWGAGLGLLLPYLSALRQARKQAA